MISRKQHGDGVGGSNGADEESPEREQVDVDPAESTQGAVGQGLASELERARAEAAGHYDRLLRAQAELQNVLKRHDRERAERARYAVEPLARDLLSVVDDLERALQHAGEESQVLAAGVELVHRSLLGVLSRHGIERIEAKGKPFDPSEHEAVAVVETSESAENTVVEEHRPGYKLSDRLLRPAMVAVARSPQGDGVEPA